MDLPWEFDEAEVTWLFHLQCFSEYLRVHERIEKHREAHPLNPGDFCRLHDACWIVVEVAGPCMRLLSCVTPFTPMQTATMYVNRWAERVTFTPDTEQRLLRRLDQLLPQSLRLPTGPYPGQRFY